MADNGLTKSYLDKSLKDLRGYTDQGLKELRIGMTKDLKEHVTEEVEKLALMTARGFEDMQKRLYFKEEIEKLKRDNRMIKQALNLPL